MAKGKKDKPTFEGSFPYTLNMTNMKDVMGRYRTASLFKETGGTVEQRERLVPIFTLKDYHHDGLPSLRRLYVEIEDPTEYKVAMTLLGSWDHWKELTECEWFKQPLEEVRQELFMKLKSEAIQRIREDGLKAFSEATRLASNKFIAMQGYALDEKDAKALGASEEKSKRPVGRPKKEDTPTIVSDEAVDADWARVISLPSADK